MKESEIKEFFRLYHEIDNLANKIFDEYKKAKLLSIEIYQPRYREIKFDKCDSNLVVKYEDSIDDSTDIIVIPFQVIYDDKLSEYIEKLKEEKIERIKAQTKAEEKAKLAKEKAEYERLKAKFETNDTNIEKTRVGTKPER